MLLSWAKKPHIQPGFYKMYPTHAVSPVFKATKHCAQLIYPQLYPVSLYSLSIFLVSHGLPEISKFS